MLSLKVKEGDYIMIGDNIKVHFTYKAGKDTLELAVEAPRELSVLRGELLEGGATNVASNT
ncbi:MAG: carbon storage regulator [Defluviitaleaceae bacterium]|nr:carbon storage regulator [Defluviitaleaceae bacterium]